MKILLVIDQFDSANNGTTISAKRFAEALERSGNEVRVVSAGEEREGKYRVDEFRLLPIADRIVKNQGMLFAKPNKVMLRSAISWADVVHFYMPFWLSMEGRKIAAELHVPHTAAFHVQPENITYTLGLGRVHSINTAIYKGFKTIFYNKITHKIDFLSKSI